MENGNFYAVIMAGGSGTRLWPLSRRKNPKQLHTLFSDKSLIRETVDRLLPIFSPDKIYISTVPDYADDIKKHLPDIPEENVIIEPSFRGNAAAYGLVTAILKEKDSNASALFVHSDAFVGKKEAFIGAVKEVEKNLIQKPDFVTLIGIHPTFPDTSLGYIELGQKLSVEGCADSYQIERFVEKPDLEKAKQFLATKKFLWNAGMFAWNAKAMLDLYKEHLPAIFDGLQKIFGAKGQSDFETVLESEYAKMEKTTIDFGIMEKTKQIIVVPASLDWSDVGSWGSLADLISKGKIEKPKANHVSVDDENCFVISKEKKLIATVGLKDIVIVDTPDATLICNAKESHKVKELLEQLEEKFL